MTPRVENLFFAHRKSMASVDKSHSLQASAALRSTRRDELSQTEQGRLLRQPFPPIRQSCHDMLLKKLQPMNWVVYAWRHRNSQQMTKVNSWSEKVQSLSSSGVLKAKLAIYLQKNSWLCLSLQCLIWLTNKNYNQDCQQFFFFYLIVIMWELYQAHLFTFTLNGFNSRAISLQ